jgi:hypothetical protein
LYGLSRNRPSDGSASGVVPDPIITRSHGHLWRARDASSRPLAVSWPRHIDVREQNLDALGLLAEYAQRLFGMTCPENLEAVVGENIDYDCA